MDGGSIAGWCLRIVGVMSCAHEIPLVRVVGVPWESAN